MRRTSRAALTLIEMLVAMAVTLIMMGAVVTLFGTVGNSISGSRATMEISERLRNARNVMQRDLSGVTVTMLPPRRPESDEGYFEYVEGPATDAGPITAEDIPGGGPPTWTSLLGDADDVLMMTIRSRGEPFVGRYNGSTIQSQTAEVIWFTREIIDAPAIDGVSIHTSTTALPTELRTQPRRTKTLFRRVLLVLPSSTPAAGDDVSVSPSTGNPNTLGDLTKRENRSAHVPGTFPYEAVLPTIQPNVSLLIPLASPRVGEDVILTNVLSFDVKAYDPFVPLRFHDADGDTIFDSGEIVLTPSDVGYLSGGNAGVPGAYVDLAYNCTPTVDDTNAPPTISYVTARFGAITSHFANDPFHEPLGVKSGLSTATYDTWSAHYDALIGTVGGKSFTGNGVNGLDDVTANGVVDDPAEADTSPPYPVPLRGIQVKIRVYEPDSRQVREVTVVQDFMPQ